MDYVLILLHVQLYIIHGVRGVCALESFSFFFLLYVNVTFGALTWVVVLHYKMIILC